MRSLLFIQNNNLLHLNSCRCRRRRRFNRLSNDIIHCRPLFDKINLNENEIDETASRTKLVEKYKIVFYPLSNAITN